MRVDTPVEAIGAATIVGSHLPKFPSHRSRFVGLGSNVHRAEFLRRIRRILFILSIPIMSSTVTFEIPREVLHATRMSEDELRRELALHLFDEGKLSFGKARELAEMSVWDFQQLLGHRGIAVHYDVDAYEQDRQTLKRLGRI